MDNNLLSGLDNLGLGNLKGLEIYNEPHKDDKTAATVQNAAKVTELKEEDMVFDKTFTCPVCDSEFKCKMVRSGRARAIGSDMDLRPRYENIDVIKYDIIACPHCGYAGMEKNFPYLTPSQRKAIKENICDSFMPRRVDPEKKIYTYQEALERHKLALVNTIVKRGKDSEKAYICLKTGWLLRGEAELFDRNDPDYARKKHENDSAENQFLRNAYDGFIKARASESFPICGMDSITIDYLLSALAIRFEEYETAAKLLSGIITSRGANSRIKDRARDLKEVLLEKMKERNADE
ncbi:MAG: DUF2225 domain-containing protein [Lachnospiraceae bacterium]